MVRTWWNQRQSQLPRRSWRPALEELEPRWVPAVTPLLTPDQAVAQAVNLEVGDNDVRYSNMGPDGNGNFQAEDAAVAYNPANNEYLVVWASDDNTGQLVNEEFEVYGQRVDAFTGVRLGGRIRVSNQGPDGSQFWRAASPAVTYNPTNNEYLVVWTGSTPVNGEFEFEIFGQRINAATGTEVGVNDFRISDMGADGNPFFDANSPAVAYNSTNNEYLVVWSGDDTSVGLLVDNEFEIFGQRLSATGAEIGINDFRISDMGGFANADFDALRPAVSYNPTNNEYLVVWEGDDNIAPLVDDESEIFGQRISGVTGLEVGANDFRISDMGPNGNTDFGAFDPAVAYNPINNEYLVVWEGDDTTDGETEIFGQRLNAAGAEVGANDFRISDMGPEVNDDFDAFSAAVAYNPSANEYLVVWEGDDNSSLDLGEGETEIFGQRLNAASGAEIGVNDFRISDMGLSGDDDSDAFFPAVAYNGRDNEYLVVWEGDDNPTGAVDVEEFEIYGQRLRGATPSPGGGAPVVVDLQARVLRQKGRPLVQVFDAATGQLHFQVFPFARSFKGQAHVLTADLTGDGIEDVIVFQGRGGKGLVQVYDGLTGERKLQTRVGRGAVKAALAEATGDTLIDLIARSTAGPARKRLAKIIRSGDLAVLPGPA